MTIWIDVEDLFHYGRLTARPSGIQRLSFEIYRALVTMPGAEVRFARHDRFGRSFQTATWDEVYRIYERMAHAPPPKPDVPQISGPKPLTRGALRAVAERIPVELREPLGQAVRAQIAALRAGWRSVRAVPGLLRSPAGTAAGGEAEDGRPSEPLAGLAKPGDTLCVFGSPWFHRDYGPMVEKAKREMGLRFALLVYDLIPMVRTEFVIPGLTEHFTRWYSTCLPLADRVFAISKATARDVEAWSDRTGLPLARPVIPIPIGTGFSDDRPVAEAEAAATPLPRGLTPGGYALFVSTIEARKNHALAFRVWRRLLDELPPERVPTLVFAGHVGWMVADLMQQIENSRHLNGKLVVVEDLSDAELAALYRGCRFTLFPSHYEGWGLPVTESLGFGKVCLASDRASIPEAGGPFCLYLDPDNATGATALIRRVIEEPGLIEGMAAKIRAEFRPVPWSDTAHAVLGALA